MADHLTPAQRSRAMKRVKLRNGSLEMALRRALFSRGWRYQCHVGSLPGRPDIVFTKQRIAIFVDGDFWHGWRLSTWEHKLSPFWREKLHANRKRDIRNFRRLRAQGWRVLRFWQHDILADISVCVSKIESVLNDRIDK